MQAPKKSEMLSIIAELPEHIQVFSDGHVKRFEPEIAGASTIPTHGFKTKDVTVDALKRITARIFVPDSSSPRVCDSISGSSSSSSSMPVVVYFHGGGFCIGSTTWLGYHIFLGNFCVVSQCVVISIDYRLAPENRLPAAYEDCFSSLEWICREVKSNSDPWLKQVDMSNLFLSGDSAGGNIAHNVAIMAMTSRESSDVKIKGLMLIHPYFGSECRTRQEMEERAEADVKMNDMFWSLSLPGGSNRDYFGCNFETVDYIPESNWRCKFPAVEVYVAGRDFLKERGVMYSEFLKANNVKDVTLVEAEGENHVFHVFHPHSGATQLLQDQMSAFIRRFW